MSLCVNIGPRWTPRSLYAFGCRAYLSGSARQPSTSLASSLRISFHRLQHTSPAFRVLSPQCPQYIRASLELCPIRLSITPHRRAVFFTTSAGDREALPANVPTIVESSTRESEESVFGIDLNKAGLQNTLDNTSAATSVDKNGAIYNSAWTSTHDGSSGPMKGYHNTKQPIRPDEFACSRGHSADIGSDAKRPTVSKYKEHSAGDESGMSLSEYSGAGRRRLPSHFSVELTRLGVLLSEKKALKHIREQFSDAVIVRDSILHLQIEDFREWLQGSWTATRATLVMQLLLGTMVTSPYETLIVLQNLRETEDDFGMRCRCLSYIGFMYKDTLTKHPELMAMFEVEVRKLRSPDVWPAVEMRRRYLSLLLWRLNANEAQSLIQSFLQKYPELSVNTTLYLVMYCARRGMDLLALSVLTRLPPQELRSPGLLTLQCCQVLLRHDVVESTPEGHNFKILPRLLEAGLTPDNVLYSRIIERALASEYSGVAWDIFHHLKTTDIQITPWTYLLLLRQAFNGNNVTGVQELLSEIQHKEELCTNVYLLTYAMNIVRRIFQNERFMTSAESLSHLLALYDRVFSREPLAKLDIVPPVGSNRAKVSSFDSGATSELVQPDAYCLSFTIWAFVLCHRSSRSVRTLWARIQDLVEARDPTMVECMRLDLIYNAFIWLNMRERKAASMANAVEILQYMLTKQLCPPTDRTWSILICGFLRCDQKAQAKQIFGIMKQSNLKTKDIRKEYWRSNWTLEYFEEHLDEILDENTMPDGTELGKAADVLSEPFDFADMVKSLDVDPELSGLTPELESEHGAG